MDDLDDLGNGFYMRYEVSLEEEYQVFMNKPAHRRRGGQHVFTTRADALLSRLKWWIHGKHVLQTDGCVVE